MQLATWPNAISLLRLPLAALFVAVESTAARAAIVVAAAVSDGLDGWLARSTGRRTRSGELIDPAADKVFILAALAGFARTGELAFWELVLLLARDLYTVVAFATALAFGLKIEFRSRSSGKLVTVLQIGAILVLLLAPGWAPPVVLATGAAGIYAIIDYTRAGLGSLRRAGRPL